MKKYYTTIDQKKTFETEITGPGKFIANGKEYEFDHKPVSSNVFILRINNKNYFVDITDTDTAGMYEVGIDGINYKVESRSELDLMIQKLNGNKSEGKLKKEIHSPMPGIIVKLNVTEGQSINKGEVLLVLEAMKMENEIKAVKDCIIKKINVSERSSVEKNELLLTLE
ncbi:MAG: biotin/lipoyl-containing protein [bacterium]